MILILRRNICIHFIVFFVIALTLCFGRGFLQTMGCPQQYNPNTWHIGDSFFYQGLGESSDIFREIAGKTTWREHDVFNLTQAGQRIVNGSYLHTIDTFDLVGRYSVHKGGDLEKATTTADVFTDLPVSEYSEGNYVVNATELVEMKYRWNNSLPNRETYTRFHTYRAVMFSTLNISSKKISTPAGTFDCWELTKKTLNTTLNRTTQEVGGAFYLTNEYNEYSYIDSITIQVDTWKDVNGISEFESHSYEAFNTTTYISKSLRIMVKYHSYRFDEENNSWVFYSGRELATLNQVTPTTTSSSSDSTVTPLNIVPILVGILVLTIKYSEDSKKGK